MNNQENEIGSAFFGVNYIKEIFNSYTLNFIFYLKIYPFPLGYISTCLFSENFSANARFYQRFQQTSILIGYHRFFTFP